MKKIFLLHLLALLSVATFAQSVSDQLNGREASPNFIIEKSIPVTAVKNQAITGTCWQT